MFRCLSGGVFLSRVALVPAPWIEGLPRDGRGFVVPAESSWVNGVPVLRETSPFRNVALVSRRGCAVCGFELVRGNPVFRVFTEAVATRGDAQAGEVGQVVGDVEAIRLNRREVDQDVPMHLSCALYSAQVCPYLSVPTAKLSSGNSRLSDRVRGGAAVFGFKDFGLLVFATDGFVDFGPSGPMVAYLDLVKDIPYSNGGDVADLYAAAVVSDSAVIDTSRERCFWSDSEQDQRELRRAVKSAQRVIGEGAPAEVLVECDGLPYKLFRF